MQDKGKGNTLDPLQAGGRTERGATVKTERNAAVIPPSRIIGLFLLLLGLFPILLLLLFHDLLGVILDVFPVPDVLVHLVIEIVIVIIFPFVVLVVESNANVGLALLQHLLLKLIVVDLALVSVG